MADLRRPEIADLPPRPQHRQSTKNTGNASTDGKLPTVGSLYSEVDLNNKENDNNLENEQGYKIVSRLGRRSLDSLQADFTNICRLSTPVRNEDSFNEKADKNFVLPSAENSLTTDKYNDPESGRLEMELADEEKEEEASNSLNKIDEGDNYGQKLDYSLLKIYSIQVKSTATLEGHTTPRLNFVDVGTRSLGQGLLVDADMAYVGKIMKSVYCLIGDEESAEDSISEAPHFASYYKLDKLCATFDINRLGQSKSTSLQHNMEVYRKCLQAFGFNALVVDGHDVEELFKAFHEAQITKDCPTAILVKTFKGKNFQNIEDFDNWYGKALGNKAEEVIAHLKSLIKNAGPLALHSLKPLVDNVPVVDITNIKLDSLPNYKKTDKVATYLDYETVFSTIAKNNARVIALDGDTKNFTFAEKIKTVDPKRSVKCFIAEQNAVSVTIGAALRDRTVAFVSAFATSNLSLVLLIRCDFIS
ncbi:transketolase-like protein 2 [Cotesia glomerata]|uniref:transketolase-like protein 2 n=1 Tax=Cotesia glomerata TaxID=32391 RepID=UPI001D0120D4|nr:transketolase-like protein 2 [Cotesia glomerata]